MDREGGGGGGDTCEHHCRIYLHHPHSFSFIAHALALPSLSSPLQPLVMSECCSCETQRGEDSDLPHDSSVFHSNEASGCLRDQTQTSNAVAWMAGTFIWTLHE